MAWWDQYEYLTLSEQIEICIPYLIVGGIILIFSALLPINFLRRARLFLGLACLLGGALVYFYLTYLYDPDYFGKDGPAGVIATNAAYLLGGWL